MLDKLLARFRKSGSSTESSSNKEEDDHSVNNVKLLSAQEAAQYRDLMKQENINQLIIVGGFLCWKDIVNCMCVCRTWNQIINCPAAGDMFFHNVLDALDLQFPVKVYHSKVGSSTTNTNDNETKQHKRRFDIGSNSGSNLKTMKDFVRFSLHESSWLQQSFFGRRLSVSTCMAKVFEFISLKLQYFDDDGDYSVPSGEHVPTMSTTIPTELKAEQDHWQELVDPGWVNGNHQHSFGLFMACQPRFQYRISFIAIPYLNGKFYQIDAPNSVKKVSEERYERYLKGKFDESGFEVENENMRWRSPTHSNSGKISSVTQFSIVEIPDDFLDSFGFSSDDPPNSMDPKIELEWNAQFRKMLFNVWKSGFLYHAPVRNYMLQLLFLLKSGQLYDYHIFEFSDHCKNNDENVTENVETLLRSRREQQSVSADSETFYSYLVLNMPCTGYSGGRSDKYYFILLTLKPSEEHQDECDFEFIVYKYYSYMIRGMALS